MIICLVLITQRSAMRGVKKGAAGYMKLQKKVMSVIVSMQDSSGKSASLSAWTGR